jgi:integrase
VSRGARTRVAKGVYHDAFGYAATVKVGKVQREKRFPNDAALEDMQTWQRRTRGTLLVDQPVTTTRQTRKRSFIRDVARYLKTRKGLSSYRADRSHLQAWISILGRRSRASLSRHDVLTALALWRTHGQRRRHQTIARELAPRTLRHRFRVLKDLYRALDGPDAPCPCDGLPWPKVPKTVPRDVPLRTIRKVTRRLALLYPQEHARLLVLATTGRRPAEVMRTDPKHDLNLRRGIWTVPAAKDGEPTQLYLNGEMIAAWKSLLKADATGAYDTTLYAQRLRKCGWPKGIRPYNVRHALAMEILRRGGDLSDVQAHLGHASIDTTRRFYAGSLVSREKLTSERLTGRLAVPAETVPAAQRKTVVERAIKRQKAAVPAARGRKGKKR